MKQKKRRRELEHGKSRCRGVVIIPSCCSPSLLPLPLCGSCLDFPIFPYTALTIPLFFSHLSVIFLAVRRSSSGTHGLHFLLFFIPGSRHSGQEREQWGSRTPPTTTPPPSLTAGSPEVLRVPLHAALLCTVGADLHRRKHQGKFDYS